MNDLQLVANTIRGLAMDGVQKANSGHPGMPMGMADIVSVLYLKHLKYHPAHPDWPDRDRFVLSAGHGSMLLYSVLHLAGYDFPMSALQSFRQWGSPAAGHPEAGHAPGVETTTGPLGQGCGNGVGMALAERMLAARFNAAGATPVDHRTYVLASDGDLMEGISHEAFAIAGHLALNKLVVFYDFNRITIEGSTDLAYSDDVRKRFEGYHWNVLDIDGHDLAAIDGAIAAAKTSTKPTIIICRTHIGHGAPNLHDTAKAHGEPLGKDEIRAAKKNLGLPEDQDFHVPDRARAAFAARRGEQDAAFAAWTAAFAAYRKASPDLAKAWDAAQSGALPDDLYALLPAFDAKPIATRAAGGKIIQSLAKAIPHLIGGSADLAPSTRTLIEGVPSVKAGAYDGRNFHFGIREHGMAALMNGMLLHGGFRVFGATFFVFLDYCRPSARIAAIANLPAIYVFTHDSFYVGEDGPTHQPIEHIASLRCMPNMSVIRPADATETGAAWVAALKNKTGPTAILLTRHNLPVFDRKSCPPASLVEKGAYVIWESAPGQPRITLIASGSEVTLALDAAKALSKEHAVRVVSMPSWDLFEKQDAAYRSQVIPPDCPVKLAIEAGSSMGWERYVGPKGRVIAMDRFGASAPYAVLAEKFGFTVDNVVRTVREMLSA